MKVVLQNVTKAFPGRSKKLPSQVIAVKDFSLEIPDGKMIGLLGPSGCGKSTTLNLLSGLLTPTSGRIFFGEDDVTEVPPENRGIGLVFQNYALYPHLTVRQNILFPLENLKGADKLTKQQRLERAEAAAKLVQIQELMDRKPRELSGGQQQRVAIARALVKMPRILLLDEPLSNLDARLRLQTREELRRIQQETGITTVFVTHDQEEAMSISDLIVVMNAGVIQQIGAPQQIYDDPQNLFVAKFLGTPPINLLSGQIRSGMLYIGDDAVLSCPGAADRALTIGIRPEGLLPDPLGRLHCSLQSVQIMGRDINVVCAHPGAQRMIHAIIRTNDPVDPAAKAVSFSLDPCKVFLFDPDTEFRVDVPLESYR